MIWVYVLFFLSGCASLIYEVVWTRQLTLLLGSTTYAITTVIVAFMSGLALGSFIAGRMSHRLNRPGRVYAGLEIIIGVYALLVPLLMSAAEPVYRAVYPQAMDLPWLLTAVRFAVSLIILMLPTACMGATLPIMMTHITRQGRQLGRSTGWLYGINTLGATAGSLLAGFALMPALGLTQTTRVAALINFTVGVAGLLILRGRKPSEALAASVTPSLEVPSVDAVGERPGFARLALMAACISGLTSMTYQIAWTRSLVMSVGSTTYSFTCILAAFILGIGLGSIAIARYADRLRRPLMILGLFELGIGLSAAVIAPVHGQIPVIFRKVVLSYHEHYDTLLMLEFLLIVAVTAIPTLLMGAAFPLMTRIVGRHHPNAGAAIGRVYVINTLGTIVGAVLTGFLLIRGEVLGIRGSIVVAALANGAVGFWLLMREPPAGWTRGGAATAGGAGLVIIGLVGGFIGRWDPVMLSSAPYRLPLNPIGQKEMLFFREDVDTTVSVYQALPNLDCLTLAVNGKPDASTNRGDLRTQLLLGHLPALLHGPAQRTCVIGLGSGMTLASIARHEGNEQLDCVEISRAVIDAAELFAPFNDDILNSDERVRLIRGDGRNHLLLTSELYDLIVSEPSNPYITGVSSLFTREFFEICRQRLNKRGLLTIWMHTYSMDPEDFRMVVRTLTEVFPYASLWQLMNVDFCLVAGLEPFHVPARAILDGYEQPPVRADLYRAGIRDAGSVVGMFVAGGKALRDWSASGRLHTDDNAILEFSAPRNLYRVTRMEVTRDLTVIQQSPFDEAVLLDSSDPASARLQAKAAASITGRVAVPAAWKRCEEGAALDGLEMLIDAYERDQGDFPIYENLTVIRNVARDPQLSMDFDAARFDKLQERMAGLAQPLVIWPQGATLTEIARTLQSTAAKYRSKNLATVLHYLNEAREIAPDDGLVVATMVLALREHGRAAEADPLLAGFLASHPGDGWACFAAGAVALADKKNDEALGWFARVLESGVVTPEQLAGDPRLSTFRDDPAFKSMLERWSASQPH